MQMAMANSYGWRTAEIGKQHSAFSFSFSFFPTINRNKFERVKYMVISNSKTANLCASRKERIDLPVSHNTDEFGRFLNHPSAIETMLNLKAMKNFQPLDDNTYRCTLPTVRLLSFEAAPVLDLRVTPSHKDCTVELLSCKFEGSEIFERQNDHFSAIMRNIMTWDVNDCQPYLEVDVKLNLTLEISTHPFLLLPVSAVEVPGNLMMQTLVDKLVSLLVQQVLVDYDKWASKHLSNT